MREPEALFWMFVFPVLMAIALGIAFPSRTTDTVIVAVVDGPARGGDGAGAAAGTRGPGAALAPGDDRNGGPPRVGADRRRARAAARHIATIRPAPRAAWRGASWTTCCSGRADGRTRGRRARKPWRRPGSRYIDWLVPGLLGMTIMQTGLWGVGFSIVQSRTRKLLKRLVATPMRRSDYLLAQILARMVFLVVEAGVLLGVRASGVRRADARLVAARSPSTIIVGALSFAGIGLLAASRAKTVEGLSGMLNLVILPMWIVSGVFFASSNFPGSAAAVHPRAAAHGVERRVARGDARGRVRRGRSPRELALLGAWGGSSFALASAAVPLDVTAGASNRSGTWNSHLERGTRNRRNAQ